MKRKCKRAECGNEIPAGIKRGSKQVFCTTNCSNIWHQAKRRAVVRKAMRLYRKHQEAQA